jgi:hypothetical protein
LIILWNGSAWSSVGGGIKGAVTIWALATDSSDNVYAGGDFLTAPGCISRCVVVYVSQALTANQWRMISLPHVPVTNATLQDTSIFGDNLPPANYDNTWVVYERNETTKAYRKLALTDALVQGKGYWIQSTSDATLDMDGTATQVITSNTNCTSSKGCYEVTLTSPVNGEASRFNMVGYPFFRSASWADVRFEVNGAAYTPSAAQPKPAMLPPR